MMHKTPTSDRLPLTISFLVPHLRLSGGVRIILKYADLLAGRGHKVVVYVRSKNILRRTVANALQIGGPEWLGSFRPRIIRIPEFTPKAISESDVIVATHVPSALAIENFPDTHGKRLYLLQHDEGLYHASRADADRAYRGKTEKIVIATWLRDLLHARYGVEAHLLLNPIDLDQFQHLPREVDEEHVRVLLLHHSYAWKGTQEGVEIVKKVASRYPNIRLIMFGARIPKLPEGTCDEYYYNLPQHRLPWLYSNSDIYLCPSWDEGFGLPSIEAMACGASLVTYDNGGSRDFAFHERTALVAPRKDKEALACELERVVRDRALRVDLARAGEAFVRSLPGWNERVQKFEQICYKTLGC